MATNARRSSAVIVMKWMSGMCHAVIISVRLRNAVPIVAVNSAVGVICVWSNRSKRIGRRFGRRNVPNATTTNWPCNRRKRPSRRRSTDERRNANCVHARASTARPIRAFAYATAAIRWRSAMSSNRLKHFCIERCLWIYIDGSTDCYACACTRKQSFTRTFNDS